jgi:hypothetical protein
MHRSSFKNIFASCKCLSAACGKDSSNKIIPYLLFSKNYKNAKHESACADFACVAFTQQNQQPIN